MYENPGDRADDPDVAMSQEDPPEEAAATLAPPEEKSEALSFLKELPFLIVGR